MGRITGVTKHTARRLILDAGAIYLNYGEQDQRLLGATEGGAAFTVEQDIREPEIDGLPGPLAGTRRVVAVHARITAQLMEQTTANLLLELAGAESEEDQAGEYDIITRKGYVIPQSAHVKNVALIGRVSGADKPVICIIKNGLADGNMELSTEDENEAKPEIQFTGHFTSDALDAEPWEIRNPIIYYTLVYLAGADGSITGTAEQEVREGGDGSEVVATADGGFVFVKWSDGILTAARTDTDVQDNLTVTAEFAAE